jgi:hypothetical protein
VSADLSSSEQLRALAPEADRMLRVQTIFRVTDEQLGQAVAAKLIDRAQEIANLTECECDVDVSVEWIRSDDPADTRGVPIGGEPPRSGRTAER